MKKKIYKILLIGFAFLSTITNAKALTFNYVNNQNSFIEILELDTTIDSSKTKCDIFGSLTDEIAKIFNAIKYILIGALIVLTILDFIKALTSEKDDELKKAASKLLKRIIIIVVIYILPLLINIILSIFLGNDFNTCLDKFL